LAESLKGATNYLLSMGEHDAAEQLLQHFWCTPPEKMESLRFARLEEEAKNLAEAIASAASAKLMEKIYGVVSAAVLDSTSLITLDVSALQIQKVWHKFKEGKRAFAAIRVQCVWRGSFLRIRNSRLQSSLLAAISRSDIPTMKALLDQGAIVNARDHQNRGATPLVAACMLGANAGVVKLLMQSGSDAQKADGDGFFPLILASRGGSLGIVAELLRGGKGTISPDQADFSNTTSLHIAARCGHSDVVTLLVEEFQANITALDCDGFNAAHLASLNGHKDLVSFFLDRGIYVDQTNHHGDSCLILACLGGHAPVVSLLLQRGCNRRMENADGLSAVDIAAYKENATLLFLLTHDEDAATKVQSLWRLFRVRRLHGAVLEKRLFEVRILKNLVSAQGACRVFLAKKVVAALRLADIRKRADAYMSQRQRDAALIIMRKWLQLFRIKKVIQRHLDDKNRIAKSFDVTRFEHFETLRDFSIAAVRIQRGWRTIFKTRTQNALVLQRFWRRCSGGREGRRRKDAWHFLLRKNLPLLLKQADEVNDHEQVAATRMQKVWRNFLYRDTPLSHRANSYDMATCTEVLLSLRAKSSLNVPTASEKKDSPATPVEETAMLRRRATVQQSAAPGLGSSSSTAPSPLQKTPQAKSASSQRFDAFQVYVKSSQKKKARVGRSSSTSSKWSFALED
jgi:ankyrin repeat protein